MIASAEGGAIGARCIVGGSEGPRSASYVQAGAASRRFPLLRGVKQGDPVSALLFIAVMEQCFRSLKKRWKSANRRRSGQYFGIVIDDPESPLSNLRFADDILVFANSSPDLTKMIAHLRDEAAKYGFKMQTTIMQPSLRTEFQLAGLRSRSKRLRCAIKSAIFASE